MAVDSLPYSCGQLRSQTPWYRRKRPPTAQERVVEYAKSLEDVPQCPWNEQELADALGISLLRAGILWSYIQGELKLHDKVRALRDAMRSAGIVCATRKALKRAWLDKFPLADFIRIRQRAFEQEAQEQERARLRQEALR